MGWSSPAMLKTYLELAEKDVAAAFGLGRKVKRLSNGRAPAKKALSSQA